MYHVYHIEFNLLMSIVSSLELSDDLVYISQRLIIGKT